ncbi:MAG: uracil phosphoribosyltransferase [Candidatus Nomurabacteria bacterium]|jgi:uracil phosphoribosyltransferase|nr:uracil phosphoribosyltransferase [Candidatus Nomurabacteria bacterium]
MIVKVASHPLIAHKISLLRSVDTPTPLFRELTSEIVTLLAYEATKNLRTKPIEVVTPLEKTAGVALNTAPRPIIVPILRAGLGMLDGLTRLMPTAEVGFLGIKRNEETLQPVTYANRLPQDLSGRQCFLVDPMLATGGTLIDSINYAVQNGASDITAICILAAPEGIDALEKAFAKAPIDLKVCVAAVDEKLNENGYIVPGLGDAGDRLYGVVSFGADD